MNQIPNTPHRQALTRREAILLIAIVVVAMALLLPAITRVREVANRMTCERNLSKLVFASWDRFHDYQRLHAGYYGPVQANGGNTQYAEDRGPHVSGVVMLLPYLQHDATYQDLVAPSATWPEAAVLAGQSRPIVLGREIEQRPWWTEPANIQPTTGRRRLDFLICPSADLGGDAVGGIVQMHTANGVFLRTVLPEARSWGRTNYLGVAGAAGSFDRPYTSDDPWSLFRGLFCNRQERSPASWGFSAHGPSTTLAFGEVLGVAGDESGVSVHTWMGCGALGTAYGLGRPDRPSQAKPPKLLEDPGPANHGAAWYRFSSHHRDGVQFAFLDGSVRLLRFGRTTVPDFTNKGINATDWSLLQQLAGLGNYRIGDVEAMWE